MDLVLKNLQPWLTNTLLIKGIEVILGLAVILFFFGLLRTVLTKRIKAADTRYRARKIITFVSYFFCFIFIAGLFSDGLKQITLLFGAIGAGVAFALQEVIASLAGWVAVSFGQFYKPGDRVLLGGIMGDVIDISILRTTLMECGGWVGADLYNGRIVRIANSFVFKEPVFNYSADFSFIWDEIKIPIRYGSDRKLTREILLQAGNDLTREDIESANLEWPKMVHKYLIEPAKVEPIVTVIATDNWLEFTLRYVVNYKQRRYLKDRLFTRILDDIDKSSGNIRIASSTLELVEAPDFNVSISRIHK